MLQSEFYERTGVQVSLKEYQAIEEIYYHFPGDKDDFCKAWCKKNVKRVKEAKAARKAAEKETKKKERLMIVMNRMEKKMMDLRYDVTIMPLSVEFLSKRDQTFLESLGFRTRISDEDVVRYGYCYNRFKRIDDTAWELRKYLKLV